MVFEVATAGWLDDLTSELGREVIGGDTWARGAAYAADGRVLSIASADRGRMLLAEVQGGRATPYQTLVTAIAGTGTQGVHGLWSRGRRPWTSRCSCPMRAECKHVAAVLVAARAAREAHVGRPAAPPGWEEVLGPIVFHPPAVTHLDGGLVHAAAIIVEVVARPGPPPLRRPEQRIVLQATRQLVNGQWAKRLPWNELADEQRHALDPRQREALIALHRAATAHLPVYSRLNVDQLQLDSFGVEGWKLLHACVEVGVRLIGPRGSELVVNLLPSVEVALEVAELPGGDLEVRVDLGDDDFPDGAERGLVGAAGLGMWGRWEDRSQRRLVLRGFTRPLPDSLHSVALDHVPLVVPVADAERFRRLFLPRLAGAIHLRGRDGAADELHDARPVVVVDVGRGEGGGMELGFSVGYDLGGGLVIPYDDAAAGAVRDPRAESDLVAHLDLLDLVPGARFSYGRGIGVPAEWMVTFDRISLVGLAATEFAEKVLPRFDAEPRIVVSRAVDLLSYQEAGQAASIEVRARERDNDWFDLHVVVRVAEHEVPFARLFSALSRGDEILILDDGMWFRLDQPELQRLRDLIAEARELDDRPPADGARINRFHVSMFEDLASLTDAYGVHLWQERVAAAGGIDLSERSLPSGLTAQLRPYQRAGFQWLAALWAARLGGVLADDMGLGKTVQALALVQHAKECGDLTTPVLVIAPTSVLETWHSEAARFTPGLRVVMLPATERRRGTSVEEAAVGADLVITSYAVARIDDRGFAAVPWRGVILDEAQFVKNPRSKGHQAVRRLRAPFVLAITGTPLENSLMDLWAILALAAPGLYPRADTFSTVYRRPIESGTAPEMLELLRRRIRPLLLRRTKAEVASDLPEKQIQVLDIALGPAHARIYERHLQRERQRMLGLLGDPTANRIEILASITRLRQLALDPALLDEEHAEVGSAKIDALVEYLHELRREGHRALVFSQFTRFLRRAESRLADEGIETTYLDGATTNRPEVIRVFREGDSTAFLISLKAGGFGLTLTEADYVFVLDPWWNPAAENQAIDRTHRIGQSRKVNVYRMVSSGTIEEKVLALQERKRDLFTKVVDEGGAHSGALNADDLRALFDPT